MTLRDDEVVYVAEAHAPRVTVPGEPQRGWQGEGARAAAKAGEWRRREREGCGGQRRRGVGAGQRHGAGERAATRGVQLEAVYAESGRADESSDGDWE